MTLLGYGVEEEKEIVTEVCHCCASSLVKLVNRDHIQLFMFCLIQQEVVEGARRRSKSEAHLQILVKLVNLLLFKETSPFR